METSLFGFGHASLLVADPEHVWLRFRGARHLLNESTALVAIRFLKDGLILREMRVEEVAFRQFGVEFDQLITLSACPGLLTESMYVLYLDGSRFLGDVGGVVRNTLPRHP